MCMTVSRINYFIKRTVVHEILIYARCKEEAKIYWEYLKEKLVYDKEKISIRLGIPRYVAGLNPKKTIILLCGQWHTVKRIHRNEFIYMMNNCICSFPIGDIDDMKGGKK